MKKRRQLISSDEAVPAKKQHSEPCSDCPWARTALRGWLGGIDSATWVQAAHGEETIECHVLEGAQCAGAAIYRANVCKNPRDPKVLHLKADHNKIFSSPKEFLAHHNTKTNTEDDEDVCQCEICGEDHEPDECETGVCLACEEILDNCDCENPSEAMGKDMHAARFYTAKDRDP